MNKSSILMIYTGGTIGMKTDPLVGALRPFDFAQILDEVPELGKFAGTLDSYSFDPLIDSSDIDPAMWQKMASLIAEKYDDYDGFVVLHGTDTMSYSASALSFMLDGRSKPVIFTGSQLPVGAPRTDGKENLVSAVEIASARCADGSARVPEVAIYFGSYLMRGNRTMKVNAESFEAFRSPNLEPLAESGINIRYNDRIIRKCSGEPLKVSLGLDTRVSILKIHPGITPQVVRNILLGPETRAVIIETYGAGNAPSASWFMDMVREAAASKILVNVTQCASGTVDMDLYATGKQMKEAGVISGRDSTTEAMLAKLFHLLGSGLSDDEVKAALAVSLRGEIS